MTEGQSPPPPAEARHVPTLSLDKVMQRFLAAGIGRSRRSLIRYCQNGLLDGAKEDTATGETWFVTEASVERAIQQISDMIAMTDAARHSAPALALAGNDGPPPAAQIQAEPTGDMVRHSETEPAAARYVQHLEHYVGRLEGELDTKNKQIEALLERDRETNFLVQGLQRMLAPLLGQPDPYNKDSKARGTDETANV